MRRLAIVTFLMLAGCDQPSFRFKPGDIVETKVGKIRGSVVTYRAGCSGLFVRFVTISMKPVCINEAEIEPAKAGAIR